MEPVLLVGVAAFVLLLVRALANIVSYSLKLVSGVLLAGGAGLGSVVKVENESGETVSVAEVVVESWVSSGFPVPTPVLYTEYGQTMGDLLVDPVTWQVFAVHVLAGVVVVVVTMGLLESSWFLGALGGLFTAALVLWLDYWYVVYGEPYVTTGEFGTWTFAAAAGAALGLIGAVLVVEPVFDREREKSRDPEEVLENVEL